MPNVVDYTGTTTTGAVTNENAPSERPEPRKKAQAEVRRDEVGYVSFMPTQDRWTRIGIRTYDLKKGKEVAVHKDDVYMLVNAGAGYVTEG